MVLVIWSNGLSGRYITLSVHGWFRGGGGDCLYDGEAIYLERHHIEQRDFATRCRHNIGVIFRQRNAGSCFFWVAITCVICH